MKTDVLIVGAGLCGLSLARSLQAEGQDYMLVESRDRVGGRIATMAVGGAHFDMGPAWFWPGQPRIAGLIEALGLEHFEQYAAGSLTYEDEAGQVRRGQGYASMQGSFRLKGGLAALTDGLAAGLGRGRLKTGDAITGMTRNTGDVGVTLASGATVTAERVVLALPPRIAAQLAYSPDLPDPIHTAMNEIATWMAGQAKAVAVYDTPFWRKAGLSGDAMSRIGPMVEIHDASPASGGPYALFGFVGVPPEQRTDGEALREATRAQLGRLFGPEAADPVALHVKDWAFDAFTSVEADRQRLFAHPHYGLPPAMEHVWDGRLLFSGTETATQFGGYLEGALEAAEHTLKRLSND